LPAELVAAAIEAMLDGVIHAVTERTYL